ncbi:UDP-glucose/GDP-mannose dehydrogenase family, NAD binding domain [Desulfotomaculum arcticum]|uniref:UDP-glucose/GDP-mannose dehydrogenase family, NAD binding domain n=1 Tax=Desulfotruncus arcticus DSM 17038 TaxID=1121424 RepID=A0A1I2P609_9FIRM|nr:UDP-glucose/GDP-mannose dehydrogenase family, NAD binding domain [Desulfotomaculum arcticum] [Desulfotruncus arcticus DSM 17038]
MEQLVTAGLAAGTLKFEQRIANGLNTEILIIAVGTPAGPDGRVGLSQINEVLSDIVAEAQAPLLIVIKSTVPPGFGVKLREWFLTRSTVRLDYLANPEFLK